MPPPEETQRRHAKYVDGLAASFKDALERMVSRVTRRVVAILAPELDMDQRRRVLPTADNLKVLRRLDRLFMNEMDAAGYKSLLNAFTGQFVSGAFPFYSEVLESLTERLETPLPKVRFSTSFKGFLAGQQTTAQKTLRATVERAAATAMQKASMSVGAVPFEELTDLLSKAYGTSIGQSETLARTSLVTFWRSIVTEAYNQIQDSLPPDSKMYFRYVGPRDRLTREWCRKRVNKVFTREQIDAMDNGHIPSVIVSGGGYNCRHHWVLESVKVDSTRKS